MIDYRSREQQEIFLKARELVKAYKKYNPNGTYLSLAFLQTDEHVGRLHIANAYYDKDHMHPLDIKEDIALL